MRTGVQVATPLAYLLLLLLFFLVMKEIITLGPFVLCRFYIRESNGSVLQGSDNTVVSHHAWLFESPFIRENLMTGQYPLSWRLVDIDQWVHFRSPKYRPLASYFRMK